MDLRLQRTRKCIADAFMEIRRKKPLEKITVKEISDAAMVNKATFYNHFESVYDLSEKLENEAIDIVMKNVPPDAWVTGDGTRKLAFAMCEHNELFDTLFSGSRRGALIVRLDKKIKETIYAFRPDYKDNLEKDVVLTTMIHGCFYATEKYQGEEFDRAIDTIVKINDYLIKEFKL